jgi:hypothetical protein
MNSQVIYVKRKINCLKIEELFMETIQSEKTILLGGFTERTRF